jgi:hypothetical protein
VKAGSFASFRGRPSRLSAELVELLDGVRVWD